MRYNRKTATIDKIEISYIEMNPRKERTIIFFHGNSNSADLWHLQLSSPVLQSYRLIAVDLPCHGQSGALSNISIQSLGQSMADFITTISNNKPYALVGFSLGGNIVTEMLPFVPSPQGLVIISSAIVGDEVTPLDIRSTALSEAVLFSGQADCKSVTLYFRTVLRSNNPVYAALLFEDYNFTALTFRDELLKSITEQRFSNEISLVRSANIPCLFMVGNLDDVIAPDLLQQVGLPLWKDKIHCFDKSGHFINVDQSEEFNTLLDEYMTAIDNHV